MPVTIVDNRRIIDNANVTTNFNQGTQNTTDFAEGTASVSLAINIGTDQLFYNGSTVDLTGETVYIWSANNATQNPFNGASTLVIPHAIWLANGTDTLVLTQAGNDRDVFKHADDQVLFQSFLIDTDYITTKDSNGEVYVEAGTVANFVSAISAVTEIGSTYTTNSKALAGGFNVFIDIIRVGNDGITIQGGSTVASTGTFAEVAVADRDTSSSAAHGIIREYTSQTFGVQGTIQFGNVSSSTYFSDSDFVLAFEDRDVSDDKWKIVVFSSTAGFTSVDLSNATITSARPGVELDFSSSHIDVLTLDAVTFTGLLNAVTFAPDASAETQSVTNCTFNQVGQIDPATITMTGTTISNTTAGASGALLVDVDGPGRLSEISFITSSTIGHAIYISTLAASTSFTLNTFDYTGYGPNGSTNAAIFNDSGQNVTLNITGGDTPTFRNGTGASTTVAANFTLTLTGIQPDSEVRFLDINKDFIDGTEQTTSSAQSVTIDAAGSLYTVLDLLTFVGGTGTATTVTVDTIGGGGEITGISITNPGSYTVNPSLPNTVSGGTGAGAQIGGDLSANFPFTYNPSVNASTTIVVFHLNFRDIRLSNFTLQSADGTLPIQQQTDRVYSNP